MTRSSDSDIDPASEPPTIVSAAASVATSAGPVPASQDPGSVSRKPRSKMTLRIPTTRWRGPTVRPSPPRPACLSSGRSRPCRHRRSPCTGSSTSALRRRRSRSPSPRRPLPRRSRATAEPRALRFWMTRTAGPPSSPTSRLPSLLNPSTFRSLVPRIASPSRTESATQAAARLGPASLDARIGTWCVSAARAGSNAATAGGPRPS